VNYENCGEIQIKCSCALFETERIICKHILCVLWRNQGDFYSGFLLLYRWRIDAQHRKIYFVNAMNLRQNEGSSEQHGIIRVWASKAKFSEVIEMILHLDIHLFKLEDMLESFTLEAEKDVRPKVVNNQGSHGGGQVMVILRDDEKITICDPRAPG